MNSVLNLDLKQYQQQNADIKQFSRAELFDYVFAHAKEIKQPNLSNYNNAKQSDEEYEEKYKRYFTEYNPTYDPELDFQMDDVPIVDDFNSEFVGEFDSGLKQGSVPERANTQFWDTL